MTKVTDDQLKKLVEAFKLLDWTQPEALDVFHDLEKSLKAVIDDKENTSWREYYFYRLGCFAEAAHQNSKKITN